MAIQSTRIRALKDAPEGREARYVLYWMQSAQRAEFNPALEYAIEEANHRGLPVLVGFGLAEAYPEASARHYAFMLQGLADVAESLAGRGVGFVIRKGQPDKVALELSQHAALVVCDAGYLRLQRQWRRDLAEAMDRPLIRVEGDVVAPILQVSNKHEYAARTIRPRIHRLWEDYLTPLRRREVRHRMTDAVASDIDLSDGLKALAGLDIDHSLAPVRRFRGGEVEARRRLQAFIDDGLARYGEERGKPERAAVSYLSPYLHYGQISPVEIALAVREAVGPDSETKRVYLEELIVRRELAINHAWWAPADYDSYDGLPEWARLTLEAHEADPRPHLYSESQLEAGETHDPYWNAAQREMVATGYMHNRLRMYWGKKILQWSANPRAAFDTILRLNNRYLLDGRDANSYTNVGWIFGLHDRPWPTQPVFGTVRSMGPNTFKSFDAEAYVNQVDRLVAAERA
ncbi:deoxyribodipyrimidine photo-lyase [Phenylobacterium sp.]|uniref:deoxyribodipyrimidine photo-lyase n=1 Tax=Phenylobacterium sp. TaxID=1871053 RepID=UPI002730CACC|nr:deoxyribodipyrimidine photo-lyase [Phenylobacterium sp.]MDP1618425.1 deoxyribodipyrimidine photo-lyase [Phenylobacterium sp.]MDP1987555.1 deoxyribodipyrimidine photo-lyase [Phenylobacterium sp.]